MHMRNYKECTPFDLGPRSGKTPHFGIEAVEEPVVEKIAYLRNSPSEGNGL